MEFSDPPLRAMSEFLWTVQLALAFLSLPRSVPGRNTLGKRRGDSGCPLRSASWIWAAT